MIKWKLFYLIPENWIMLISTNRQAISLELEINWGIMISDIRHVLNSLNPLCHNICMVHGNQRDTDTTQRTNIWWPHPCTVDDTVCFDGTTRSLYHRNSFNSQVTDFCLNSSNSTVLKHLQIKKILVSYYNVIIHPAEIH